MCQHSKSPTIKQAPLHFSRYLVQKKSSCLYISRFSVPHSIPLCYQTEHQLAVCQQVATNDGFTMLQLHHTVHLVIPHACWMTSTVLRKYENQHQTHVAHHTFCKKLYFFTTIQNYSVDYIM